MKKAFVLFAMLLVLCSFAVAMGSKEAPAPAAAPVGPVPTLAIDYQCNVAVTDYAGNYLSYKGPVSTVTKDQFDAVSGASKLESTLVFNYYRNDIFGKKLLPGGLRSLFLYPVADEATRVNDALAAFKNADGSITVRYIHRGTAYQVTTDKAGKLMFPGASFQNRKVGYIAGAGPQVLGTDFSPDGTAAKADWAKIWDAKIMGGKVIGTTTNKTGDIVVDIAASDLIEYEGALQFTFEANVLKIAGELKINRK